MIQVKEVSYIINYMSSPIYTVIYNQITAMIHGIGSFTGLFNKEVPVTQVDIENPEVVVPVTTTSEVTSMQYDLRPRKQVDYKI